MKELGRVRIHQADHRGVLIELSGEFDIQKLGDLRNVLSEALRWGRSAYVDLSGITFLDTLCVRELAVQHQLHAGRLALCNPSWQAELSVAASELEGWIQFHFGKWSAGRAKPVRPGIGLQYETSDAGECENASRLFDPGAERNHR